MIKRNAFYLLPFWIFWMGCATGEVDNFNEAPVANLGPDFEIELDQIVKLHGGMSFDKENDTLTYRWKLTPPNGSEASLTSTNFIETEFVVDVSGTYVVQLIVNDGLVDSAPDKLSLKTAGAENRKPIAKIAPLMNTIPLGAAVMFDGSNSLDPEGSDLSFDWLIEGAPEKSVNDFDDAAIAKPTFLPDVPGDYEISLVVDDGNSKSEPAVINLRVEGTVNEAPLADAGANREVPLNALVQLDAKNSSDKEGATLTYLWTMKKKPRGSTASISAPTIEKPTFMADELGSYEIELLVNDGELSSAPSLIVIEAKQGNLAPTADAGPDKSGIQGSAILIDGGLSQDPEGATLLFTWTLVATPPGSSASIADPRKSSFQFTPDKAGIYDFSLVVNDGMDDSAPDTLKLTVTPANTAPSANAGSDISANVGQDVLLDGTASSDPENDTLTYLWTFVSKPVGSTVSFDDATSSTPIFTPDTPGEYRVSLLVNDAQLSSPPDEVLITAIFEFPKVEGDLVITEIMSNPKAVPDSLGEWFELYNRTNKTFQLRNCVISDLGSDSHVIQHSVVVQPSSYVTLARSSSPGFTPDYAWAGFAIANANDEIILECDGKEISNVLIDNTFAATNGASLSLLSVKTNETDNDQGPNWCVSTHNFGNGDFGTPGAANGFNALACP